MTGVEGSPIEFGTVLIYSCLQSCWTADANKPRMEQVRWKQKPKKSPKKCYSLFQVVVQGELWRSSVKSSSQKFYLSFIWCFTHHQSIYCHIKEIKKRSRLFIIKKGLQRSLIYRYSWFCANLLHPFPNNSLNIFCGAINMEDQYYRFIHETVSTDG